MREKGVGASKLQGSGKAAPGTSRVQGAFPSSWQKWHILGRNQAKWTGKQNERWLGGDREQVPGDGAVPSPPVQSLQGRRQEPTGRPRVRLSRAGLGGPTNAGHPLSPPQALGLDPSVGIWGEEKHPQGREGCEGCACENAKRGALGGSCPAANYSRKLISKPQLAAGPVPPPPRLAEPPATGVAPCPAPSRGSAGSGQGEKGFGVPPRQGRTRCCRGGSPRPPALAHPRVLGGSVPSPRAARFQ